MKSVIAGLKWVATFLENRFPEKVDLSQLATKDEVGALYDVFEKRIADLEKVAEKHQEAMQTISLRVGLARPIQTVLQKRS